jgi:hypothetical protein
VGASSERIAIDITASANVAEVAKARSEVSALGEVAHKATTTLTEDQKRMAQAIRESDGSIAGIRQRFRELTPAIQQTTLAVEAQTVAVEESATAWRLSSGRIASASVATLFAFEGFARGAAAGESSARAALRSVSLLAFAFGPEVGIPIAGAAALGDALVEMWTRSGKAAANARTEFEKRPLVIRGLRRLPVRHNGCSLAIPWPVAVRSRMRRNASSRSEARDSSGCSAK